MLGEIHEYQIKGFDFVMLMCCYSKLRFDVLLIIWHLLRKSAFSAVAYQWRRSDRCFPTPPPKSGGKRTPVNLCQPHTAPRRTKPREDSLKL